MKIPKRKILQLFRKNEDFNKLNQRLDIINNNIIIRKSLNEKRKYIQEIIKNKNFNDNEILSNLDILNGLYSLDEKEFKLQLIYSFDFKESFSNPEIKLTYEPSSFLNFINNRKKIIYEIKNANNYTSEFRAIL